MNREQMLSLVVSKLKQSNFHVATFFGSNTCFDLIAKNGNITLVIKIYENIDSIRKEQGEELKKLGQTINATCLIIGEKTKVFNLKDDTVYNRYDIRTITPKAFEKVLDHETLQSKYFKGKYIVDLDSNELKRKREELNISLQELANRIGVATDTLNRFEKGSSTSLETAKKLEHELNENLVKEINIFDEHPYKKDFDEEPKERLLEKMHDIGLKMALFNHSPFKAIGSSEHGLFITTGKGKFDIPKKALELKKASTVVNSDSIIVTTEYKYKSIDGVPIIEESDLETISKLKDLKKIIHEREQE
ncbi:MAG: helix-turn-helix domain-containing protein [archaeon]|nr:helix-turn-helix domain-containing protein [archaeon]